MRLTRLTVLALAVALFATPIGAEAQPARRAHRVGSVPVVERSGSQRRLVGMVSRGDLFRGGRNTP